MRLLPARLNDKPQYVFHPLRALRRARYGGPSTDDRREVAELPWELPLEVHAHEAIGYSILSTGVFDPCVTESMHRLIDPGDVVYDVGANVGYLSSLAARRAGPTGTVHSFEPHPRVFDLLSSNAARWAAHDVAPVHVHQTALSDRSGSAELNAGPLFHVNMGLATLSPEGTASDEDVLVEVEVDQLDAVVTAETVGLLKIDVEGHEPEVLRGARGLLESGRVRDVVFEDHHLYPDESTAVVENAGYHLFSLSNDLLGVRLGDPSARGETSEWPGPSYLATKDPARAQERLRRRGWQVPGIGPSVPRRRRR